MAFPIARIRIEFDRARADHPHRARSPHPQSRDPLRDSDTELHDTHRLPAVVVNSRRSAREPVRLQFQFVKSPRHLEGGRLAYRRAEQRGVS